MESVNETNSGIISCLTYADWQFINNIVLAFSKAKKLRLGSTQPPTQ
jgi:hypothetical protein